jgi:hypothetical protein
VKPALFVVFAISALLLTTRCSDSVSPAAATPRLVDVVWKVQTSTSVARGTLYVFLSEGTLVITRPGDVPMMGNWTQTPDGLTMLEQGISYRTEVLSLTHDALHLRSYNPGPPVDISLARSE